MDRTVFRAFAPPSAPGSVQVADVATPDLATAQTGAGTLAAVTASVPSVRLLTDATRSGRLAGANPRRQGWIIHNATDGTLLVTLGAVDATLQAYTLAVGPGQIATHQPVAPVPTGEMRYRLVAAADLTAAGFPAGVFLPATGGAVAFTELSEE